MPDIRVVSNRAFGRACLRALLDGIAGHERPVIGLPTGNTPVGMYEELRSAVVAGNVDVSSWRPYAIDEYGGPRTHPCSNKAFFARYWDVIPGAGLVEQFDPEADDVALEAERMGRAIEKAGGLTVALLGIGMNGHLAFNEPGSATASTARRMELHEASRASASACWGEDAPAWGLTLGLRELLQAPVVVLMANGAAKAHIVAEAINGPESNACPASLVRRALRSIVVLDESAAGELRKT